MAVWFCPQEWIGTVKVQKISRKMWTKHSSVSKNGAVSASLKSILFVGNSYYYQGHRNTLNEHIAADSYECCFFFIDVCFFQKFSNTHNLYWSSTNHAVYFSGSFRKLYKSFFFFKTVRSFEMFANIHKLYWFSTNRAVYFPVWSFCWFGILFGSSFARKLLHED